MIYAMIIKILVPDPKSRGVDVQIRRRFMSSSGYAQGKFLSLLHLFRMFLNFDGLPRVVVAS